MWFTYDSMGAIQWYAVSGAALQADGSYAGEVFRFTGKPFNQIAGSQAFSGSTPVGTARLRFTGTTALSFNYTVDGISQSKQLSRFAFGPEPSCSFTNSSRASASNYTDIWWNAAESGWGLTLAHQGNTVFGLWYTYDSMGRAQWVSGLATLQADGSFKGDLNRATSGTPFNQINNSAATSFPVPKAGEFELRFSNGETGSFKYKLDGIEQTKAISRFVFGGPVSVCAASSNPGGNGGGGENSDCFRPFTTGDQRSYRNTSEILGAPFPIPATVFSLSERVRDGSFDGQAVKVVENLNAAGQIEARDYYRSGSNGTEHVASESIDVSTGQVNGTTRFTPAIIFPRSLAIGASSTYNGVATITGTAAGTLTRTINQTYTLVGRESVTVPAGTYANACKIETRETVTAPEVSSVSTSTLWTLGSVGDIKVQFNGTAAGFQVNTKVELTNFSGN